MRNLFTLVSLFVTLVVSAAPSNIKHVHPLNWWAGMAEPSLQIMLHGDDISSFNVNLVGANGLTIDSIARVDNPNYLFIYVNTANAPAQQFSITLTEQGKKKPSIVVPYELKQREDIRPNPFDASDVVYLFMPDRFINGNTANDRVEGLRDLSFGSDQPDSRHGGDLAGVTKALPYLSELGITAIWPTPVLINDMNAVSYHGYAITDYYTVDPRFGSNEEYKALIADCHNRGIKVIMDLVFNHCGSLNFLFTDLPQDNWFNNNSKYVQSTYKTGAVADTHVAISDRNSTQDGWFVETMPDFNQKNPLVIDYLIQTALWWTEYAHIDGIRQDTYPYCDMPAMAKWCARMEKEYPGYNIVGEVWINNNVGISWWQQGSPLARGVNTNLKSIMDFPLMSLINTAVDEQTNDWDRGFARIYEYLTQDMVFADPFHLLTFLDNHDTDRFAPNDSVAANINRYKQALTLLLTLRGIPQLYFGDEIAMSGNKQHGDGTLRKDFPAAALSPDGRTNLQSEAFNFAKLLLNYRKQHRELAFGSLKHFAPQHGCYVYSRTLDGHTTTVILNGTSSTQNLPLPRYAEVLPTTQAINIVNNTTFQPADSLTLAPREIVILSF